MSGAATNLQLSSGHHLEAELVVELSAVDLVQIKADGLFLALVVAHGFFEPSVELGRGERRGGWQ